MELKPPFIIHSEFSGNGEMGKLSEISHCLWESKSMEETSASGPRAMTSSRLAFLTETPVKLGGGGFQTLHNRWLKMKTPERKESDEGTL